MLIFFFFFFSTYRDFLLSHSTFSLCFASLGRREDVTPSRRQIFWHFRRTHFSFPSFLPHFFAKLKGVCFASLCLLEQFQGRKEEEEEEEAESHLLANEWLEKREREREFSLLNRSARIDRLFQLPLEQWREEGIFAKKSLLVQKKEAPSTNSHHRIFFVKLYLYTNTC